MRIQCRLLFAERLDDMRVAVPDVRHVVVHVEVAIAVGIKKPYTLAAHDVHGLVVEQAVSRAQELTAALHQC